MKNFLHFVLFRKMEWTDQHNVKLCREFIAFELFTLKPGSKENVMMELQKASTE